MTLDELLQKNEEDIFEAIHTQASDYLRYWHHFTPEEKEAYVKEGHKPKSGIWIYKHREALGLTYKDKDVIVHHKNHDKHDFSKENLKILTRSEHAIEDPNARKNFKCSIKGCGNEHYAHKLCFKHYMQKYRKDKQKKEQKK